MIVSFITGNLRGCLTKELILLKSPKHSITPNLDYYDTKTRVKFNGSCLKQDEITYTHGKVVNIYIVYEIIK